MSSVLLSDCIAGKKFEINCLLLSQQYRELDLKAGKKKKKTVLFWKSPKPVCFLVKIHFSSYSKFFC